MLFFSSLSILKFTNTICRYYSVIESILCFISHHWFCRYLLAWKKSQSLKNKEYIDIFVLFFNQLIHFHMQFEFMYGFLQNLVHCFHALGNIFVGLVLRKMYYDNDWWMSIEKNMHMLYIIISPLLAPRFLLSAVSYCIPNIL